MSQAERMKALRERKIAQGLRQVLVWVPADRVEELRQIAQEMRDRHSASSSAGGRGDGEG
jgi:hypothetical protein